RVERAPDVAGAPGTFVQIASMGPNSHYYTSSGLTGGTTYWYRVRAYNMLSGASGYSNQISVLTQSPPTPPAAPTALVATVAGSAAINLTWVDNATNETGFNVERAP